MRTKKQILAEMNGHAGHMDHLLKTIGLEYVNGGQEKEFTESVKARVEEYKNLVATMEALELEYKAAKK